MNGKYQQIIDDKIGELMRVHDDDEEAVTKALAAWFQENHEILAGRDIENWLEDHAPKWNIEGALVVDDQTVIQVDHERVVFWKNARPEHLAAWMKRS